jgi:hypothetical protein
MVGWPTLPFLHLHSLSVIFISFLFFSFSDLILSCIVLMYIGCIPDFFLVNLFIKQFSIKEIKWPTSLILEEKSETQLSIMHPAPS